MKHLTFSAMQQMIKTRLQTKTRPTGAMFSRKAAWYLHSQTLPYSLMKSFKEYFESTIQTKMAIITKIAMTKIIAIITMMK